MYRELYNHRTALIRSALGNLCIDESNSGSNFHFRHFGADIKTFEVAGSPGFSDLIHISVDAFGQNLGVFRDFISAHVSPKVSEMKV